MEIGDVVRLKSGGPLMTITSTHEDEEGIKTAWCEWFKDDSPQARNFNIDSLEKAEEKAVDWIGPLKKRNP
ncbi:MAG: DUF2158 domain-containing protein [Desulfurellaceae bacterium]|nr:DUF2158 domain-containing protein [Desulfurellaceae bacterium]